MDLCETLGNPPKQRTEIRYIQWIAETKERVEHINNDPKVRRLLHACLRHLEVLYRYNKHAIYKLYNKS